MKVDLAVVTPAYLDYTFVGLESLPGPGEERFAGDMLRSPGGGERMLEGLVPLGSVIPVVGEQRRLLNRPVTECGLEVAGDLAVEVAALLGQQARLGRFLR